jgi:hypothetical protein
VEAKSSKNVLRQKNVGGISNISAIDGGKDGKPIPALSLPLPRPNKYDNGLKATIGNERYKTEHIPDLWAQVQLLSLLWLIKAFCSNRRFSK